MVKKRGKLESNGIRTLSLQSSLVSAMLSHKQLSMPNGHIFLASIGKKQLKNLR